MNTIKLNVKIQAIYYQTPENTLGILHATSNKRISLLEAEEILKENAIIFYDDILKVKYEDRKIELPMEIYEKYLLSE